MCAIICVFFQLFSFASADLFSQAYIFSQPFFFHVVFIFFIPFLQIAKLVKARDGQQVAANQYTFLNAATGQVSESFTFGFEIESLTLFYLVCNMLLQVVFFYLSPTNSLCDLEPVVQRRVESWGANGMPRGPAVAYTDSCCQERQTLHRMFERLEGDRFSAAMRHGPIPLLALPVGPDAVVDVMTVRVCNVVCDALEREQVLGLDVEWTVSMIRGA